MFFGIDGVIVNKKNACGLTSAVSKVSSGALEFLPIYSVKFVKDFMEEAQKAPNGFQIISTNISEEESDLHEMVSNAENLDDEIKENKNTAPLTPINELFINKKENLLLVLGSEGEGVSRTINSLASARVTIPPAFEMTNVGKYPFNLIDSLNVGVSAATLIYHI